MIIPARLRLDLAGLMASSADEIFSALDFAGIQEGGQTEIQVTEVRLDLPVALEFVPGRASGGPRVLGRLLVYPPSSWPTRRTRRPGRLHLSWTPREEPAREQ